MSNVSARFALQGLAPKRPFRQRIGYRQEQIMRMLPTTFMALVDALEVEKGNISRMIAQLEERGLVSRVSYGRGKMIVPASSITT